MVEFTYNEHKQGDTGLFFFVILLVKRHVECTLDDSGSTKNSYES